MPVKLFCILRVWLYVSKERQGRVSPLDPNRLENKVNLTVFRTDGFLPCSGISLAKWSLTLAIHKYQTQLYVDL